MQMEKWKDVLPDMLINFSTDSQVVFAINCTLYNINNETY